MAERVGFDEFLAARSPSLLRTARMLTREWAAAEDLLQEALTKAWFAWSRFSDNPEPYVRRIIVTSFISRSRRWWRREVPTADMPESRGMDQIGAADDRDVLWRALGRLPARQRAVVVLRYYEDLPETQVATILSCSTGTVKSQAARALAKLRVDASLTPVGSVDRLVVGPPKEDCS